MSSHEIFDQSINLFLGTVNKQASRRKKLRLKPWLTVGLVESIRYKNRLFKNIIIW